MRVLFLNKFECLLLLSLVFMVSETLSIQYLPPIVRGHNVQAADSGCGYSRFGVRESVVGAVGNNLPSIL